MNHDIIGAKAPKLAPVYRCSDCAHWRHWTNDRGDCFGVPPSAASERAFPLTHSDSRCPLFLRVYAPKDAAP